MLQMKDESLDLLIISPHYYCAMAAPSMTMSCKSSLRPRTSKTSPNSDIHVDKSWLYEFGSPKYLSYKSLCLFLFYEYLCLEYVALNTSKSPYRSVCKSFFYEPMCCVYKLLFYDTYVADLKPTTDLFGYICVISICVVNM